MSFTFLDYYNNHNFGNAGEKISIIAIIRK